MFRVIWFLGCLLVAALLAVICQSLIPVLTSSLSPDGISHGIYDLLNRSGIVRIATSMALFGVFMTILGLGGQVLVDFIFTRRFHQDLEKIQNAQKPGSPMRVQDFMNAATEAGDLLVPSQNYVASANASEGASVLTVPLPAERFYGYQTQVQSRLHLWLFHNLPSVLFAAGFILLFLALVVGVDDMLFRSQISSQQPVSGLLRPLQIGVLAVAVTGIASIIVRLLVSFLVELRRDQALQLNSLLDSLFLRTPSETDALRQPLKVLSDAQVLIAEDRTEQMGKVVNDALALLTDKLAGEFNKQIKSTGKLLEETEKQVTKSTVAVQAAHETLSKYARGQSSAIDKALGAALKNHLRDDEKARAALTKTVGQAVKSLDDGLKSSAKSTTDLIEGSLSTLNAQFGAGLTDTATNLKETQADIARLVSAIEKLASRPIEVTAPTSPAREEYLRLVGTEDPALDTPSLDDLDSNADRADKLTQTLKRGGGLKPKKNAGAKASGKLSSALKDLKDGSNPSDLPDL